MTDAIIRTDMTVDLVKCSADDLDVVQAARVSTGKDLEEDDGGSTTGLIGFLMKNRHGTPFEHNFFKFRIEAPIFVWREFMRHRIGWSYNETSGRYRQLDPVFYVPALDRPLVQQGKPGHYTFVQGTYEQVVETNKLLCESYMVSWDTYCKLLDNGVAKEIARACLPVAIYSSAYVSCNARSLMAFLSLRTKREGSLFPSFPQREIEMVAERIEFHFANAMPITYAAFNEYRRVSP
jgi:thymidylate synthase (FAD)